MMDESKYYAEMIREKYTGIKAGPLLCWDIFLNETEQHLSEEIAFLNKLKTDSGWNSDLDFEHLIREKWTLVLTDLSQKIIWTSSGFYPMTGYRPEEVNGRRPSFLQGEKTSLKARNLIADKIRKFEPAEAKIINYRKDGMPYLCHVKILPLKNCKGEYSHFLGIEKSVKKKQNFNSR